MTTSRVHPTQLDGIGPADAGEVGHVQLLALDSLNPSPKNLKLYRPVDPKDPSIISMAESMRGHGVLEPLVVTLDGYIVSGHRRYVAARLAGLEQVPCRVLPIRREDDLDAFIELLATHNFQRVKTVDEQIREEVVLADPDVAYQSLIEHRAEKAHVGADPLTMEAKRDRKEISEAKWPLFNAIIEVLNNRRKFWPLSDRMIHYGLIPGSPRVHASKPGSRYRNDLPSYKACVDLLLRMRLDGSIPMDSIADPTRPVTVWTVYRNAGDYIRKELDGLFRGFWRDLMQSQPNHIELIVEKLTVLPIVRPVAMKYCIPVTTSRGYASLPARAGVADRFQKSGKDKLVLLLVSDFDPDGQIIGESFARSLRDDFSIEVVHPIRAALTAAQVKKYNLPPGLLVKAGSKGQVTKSLDFITEHGAHVWELEALEPEVLQQELRNAIDAVIDREAFNHELDAERDDAATLEVHRRRVLAALGEEGP